MGRNRAFAVSKATKRVAAYIGSPVISIGYQTSPRYRPLPVIRIRTAAGDSRRGWLIAGGRTIPVALGRGGVRANKRQGDGGTPKGTFPPRQLWWRADRHPRPPTFLTSRAIGPEDPRCESPASRHYNQPVRRDRTRSRCLPQHYEH